VAGGFAAALSMMQANLMMIVTPPDSRGRLVGVEMVFMVSAGALFLCATTMFLLGRARH